MKSLVWKGVLAFSLALNVAVAATVGYHLWWAHRSSPETAPTSLPLSPNELKQGFLPPPKGPAERRELHEKRRLLQEKKSELLDIMAAHPGDLKPAQKHIDELLVLQAQMETAALAHISKILAELPEDKRQQFLTVLKNRACRGPGMMGPGGRGRMGPKGGPIHPDPRFKPPTEN